MTEGEPVVTKRKMTDAEYKMWSLSDDVMDKIYNIVNDLLVPEQQKLIYDYFGSDFFDFYADWLEEE